MRPVRIIATVLFAAAVALIDVGVGYNPATNRWSPLPTAPLRDRTNHLAVWIGDQVLIWGGNCVQSDPGTGNATTFADGASHAIRPALWPTPQPIFDGPREALRAIDVPI